MVFIDDDSRDDELWFRDMDKLFDDDLTEMMNNLTIAETSIGEYKKKFIRTKCAMLYGCMISYGIRRECIISLLTDYLTNMKYLTIFNMVDYFKYCFVMYVGGDAKSSICGEHAVSIIEECVHYFE